jgi:hypothetical protein
MVPISSAEIWDSEKVLEPDLETTTTENFSILKLDTEDVLLAIITSSNAEDMVDQIKTINPPKLMLDAQENHGRFQLVSKVHNSESLEATTVGSTERELMVYGDHSNHTTSGTTTMVLLLYAEILASVKVLLTNPETAETSNTSILLDIEDAITELQISCNAESTVDQTTMTEALMLMFIAQENHGEHTT